MSGDRYLYGDTETAAIRLGLVADFWESTTRSFLREVLEGPPKLAVDLGCGPGHTTRLLHEVTGSTRTVGLDQSEAFVERARRDAPPGVEFEVHDVRTTPFPTEPADVVYARLLLAHLRDPKAVVAGWATQLAPGGLLLLDEMEPPDAGDARLAEYLERAERVVATQGGTLFVGPALRAMPDPPGTERVHDDLAEFTPPAAGVARMCRMNLDVLWEREELPADDPELRRIAHGLDQVIDNDAGIVTVWRMRQLAFRRSTSE